MTSPGDATAKKILDAGRDIISRRGYSNFSYADVSAAVSIHKASIHHHFPTKADLALAVANYSSEIFSADMATLAANGADPASQLHAYLDYWETCLVREDGNFCVAGMLGAEAPSLRDDVAAAVADYFHVIATWLENLLTAGVMAGQFRLGSPVQDEAAALLSLVYGAMLVARTLRDPAHFKRVTLPAVARLSAS